MYIQNLSQNNASSVSISRFVAKPADDLSDISFSSKKSNFLIGASLVASLLPMSLLTKDTTPQKSDSEQFSEIHISSASSILESRDIQVPYLVTPEHSPLEGKTIMVNPGHGCMKDYGQDKGAVGRLGRKKIYEMDVNDGMAEHLASELKKMGAKVIYVNDTRVLDIRDAKLAYSPDAFIACHCDAPNAKDKNRAKYSGEAVFANGEKSEDLAEHVTIQLKKDLTVPNNGIKADWAKRRGYTVLEQDSSYIFEESEPENYVENHKRVHQSEQKEVKDEIPSLIIEYGYMTNKHDLKALVDGDYQKTAGELVAKGVARYFETIEKRESEIEKAQAPRKFYEDAISHVPDGWTIPVRTDEGSEGIDR